MNIKISADLKSKIYDICDQLVNSNQLVTTKMVLSAISNISNQDRTLQLTSATCLPTTYNGGIVEFNLNRDSIASIINAWRLARMGTLHNNVDCHQICLSCRGYTKLLEQNMMNYKKNLMLAKRQIIFLKAKIKSLTGYYNKQRKELIMRIEGMLYK